MKETTNERVVEAVADAMWQAESERAAGRPRLIEWEDENPDQQHAYRTMAQAALAAARPFIMEEAAGIAFNEIVDGELARHIAQAIRTAAKTDGGGV